MKYTMHINACKSSPNHPPTPSSVQPLSHVQLFVILWSAALQASLSITNSWSLIKLLSVELVMSPNHLILCNLLLLLPSVFPSFRVFSNELVLCIRWSKCWSFSFGISPSNEYSGLISFEIDWFDLLAVKGTPQHHSSKAYTYNPAIPLLGIHTEKTRIERHMYPNVHRSTVYNSQDMEAT